MGCAVRAIELRGVAFESSSHVTQLTVSDKSDSHNAWRAKRSMTRIVTVPRYAPAPLHYEIASAEPRNKLEPRINQNA